MIYTDKFRFQFGVGIKGSQNPEIVFNNRIWEKGMNIAFIPLVGRILVCYDGYARSSTIVSFEKIVDDGTLYELKDKDGFVYRLIVSPHK